MPQIQDNDKSDIKEPAGNEIDGENIADKENAEEEKQKPEDEKEDSKNEDDKVCRPFVILLTY